MRSSTGAHFIALDHVRALAAFMVFTWHFTHYAGNRFGYPVMFEYVPAVFPLALLDEGHTGVALFMTLSGYLFAKLLVGKTIDYRNFLWNRVLRLLPLLFVVLAIVGIQKIIRGEDVALYVYSIAEGVLLPTLPNGAWSITVEFHYYLVLPIFLWMLRKSKALPISIVIAAVALRSYLHHELGEIESLAYGTIIGRIDQFALGMLAYHFRAYFAHRHALAVSIISAFAAFYGYFDLEGGLYQYRSDIYQHPFPSPSPLWIAIPTIEGIAYAVGIAWYETSFSPSPAGISRFIGRIGEYSYSIYLLHYFVVFSVAKFVQERVMDITNFNLACLWSAVCFLLMMPLGYLSFRFVEAPFLKLRRSYIIAPRCNDNAAEAVSVKFPG